MVAGTSPDVPSGDSPRVGGHSDGIWWTGGSNRLSSRATRYSTNNARRPTVFRESRAIEQAVTAGLSDDLRLGSSLTDESTGRVTLISWIANIRVYMTDCGLDTVFRVYDGATDTETNVLESWGTTSLEDMKKWVLQLQTGVVMRDGVTLPVCPFDLDNLRWSGRAISSSLKTEFWNRLRSVWPMDTPGPLLFVAAVSHLQQTSAAAVRILERELMTLRLTQEPGQHVVNFVQKVSELCKTIDGTGQASIDLPAMVASLFLGSDVLPFSMFAVQIHLKVEHPSPGETWEWVCQELSTRFMSLKGQGLWSPLEGRRADALVSQLSIAAPGNPSGRPPRACYTCGEVGHLQNACPQGTSNQGTGRRGRRTGTGVNAPPKGNAPTCKMVDGVKWCYCETCNRWTKGTGAHLTLEHVPRRPVAPPAPTAVANVAVVAPSPPRSTVQFVEPIATAAAYHGGTLSLRGGMLGVGKVTDGGLTPSSIVESTQLEPSGCEIAQLESHLRAMEGLVPKVGFKLSTLDPTDLNDEKSTCELSCDEFDEGDPDRSLWPDEPPAEQEPNGTSPTGSENVGGLHLVTGSPPLASVSNCLYMLTSPDPAEPLLLDRVETMKHKEWIGFLRILAKKGESSLLMTNGENKWVSQVEIKLQAINIASELALVDQVLTVNDLLRQRGLSVFFSSTLLLIQQIGRGTVRGTPTLGGRSAFCVNCGQEGHTLSVCPRITDPPQTFQWTLNPPFCQFRHGSAQHALHRILVGTCINRGLSLAEARSWMNNVVFVLRFWKVETMLEARAILYRDQAFWLCPHLLPSDTLAPPPCRVLPDDDLDSARRFNDVRRAEQEGDRLGTCEPERRLWSQYYPNDMFPESYDLVCERGIVEEAHLTTMNPEVRHLPDIIPLIRDYVRVRTSLVTLLGPTGNQTAIDQMPPELQALTARFPGMSLEVNTAYCARTLEEELVGSSKTLLNAALSLLSTSGVLFTYERPSHRNWDSDASDDEALNL